jgi:hypothetical protein
MATTKSKIAPTKTRARKAPAPVQATSKIEKVLTLLRRGQGASLTEMVKVTGWLPHTTRAALTGLRKKGHAIGKTSRDGVTIYSVAA